jgi:GAF domain-containing protein
MIAAPLPPDEDARLQALRELLILDTPPEERFDRITRFAMTEFEVPIATLSLVDRDRQWFKSRFGLDVCETPREHSFCSHTILERRHLVVPDTLKDARFRDNPLVVGPPGIRFYAGAILRLPHGPALGALCLMDHRPREIDAIGLSILGALRDLVLEELVRKEGVA